MRRDDWRRVSHFMSLRYVFEGNLSSILRTRLHLVERFLCCIAAWRYPHIEQRAPYEGPPRTKIVMSATGPRVRNRSEPFAIVRDKSIQNNTERTRSVQLHTVFDE
jgi:hypothetical protein